MTLMIIGIIVWFIGTIINVLSLLQDRYKAFIRIWIVRMAVMIIGGVIYFIGGQL